jgi:retron-type reverse transcriptase
MGHAPEKYYREFEIPKKTGGMRKISTPRVFLKTVQRWILLNILYKRPLPEFVTGFTPRRSIVTNAGFHVGKKYLARIDIENFFPSIRYQRIFDTYSSFGFPEKVTRLFTSLSIKHGALPQGAPTSPYLANLTFLKTDNSIFALSKGNGATYSRYADDLTFSSDQPLDPKFLGSIEELIVGAGFRVNQKKLSYAGPGRRLMATGMVVNVSVHPTRQVRRRLRAKFHQARLDPEQFKDEVNQLLGWAAFANMYDKTTGQAYLSVARNVRDSNKDS